MSIKVREVSMLFALSSPFPCPVPHGIAPASRSQDEGGIRVSGRIRRQDCDLLALQVHSGCSRLGTVTCDRLGPWSGAAMESIRMQTFC